MFRRVEILKFDHDDAELMLKQSSNGGVVQFSPIRSYNEIISNDLKNMLKIETDIYNNEQGWFCEST
ncbi:MAG: hypothetical protein LBI03_02725 [Clostridiales bacterium]|jgi:hypothetical protein|nr:hypothetical protein [Clostridiales bacterium]